MCLGNPPITREDAYSRQVALDVAGNCLGHDLGAWGTGGSIAAEVVAGPPIASIDTPWSQKAPRR